MTKVSVIVPIYNVEKYLRRSIESIQKQTLKDIEIILINDGSSDGSLAICQEYQKKDNRIEIIDKPNGGVSSARNAGLEIAKGDYIGFVDPDDWIESEMFNSMYNLAMNTVADICISDYIVEKAGTSIPITLEIDTNLLKKEDINREIIAGMLGSSDLNSGSTTIMGSVCRLLIKKELIIEYNIRFTEDISFMEDLIFCVQLLTKSNFVCINRGLFYHYITNPNSAVTSYKVDLINTQQKVYDILEYILKEEHLFIILEPRMNTRFVNMVLSAIANEVHKDNPKHAREKIKQIRKLSHDENLISILKGINTKGFTFRKKLVFYALENKKGKFLYYYYRFSQKII